MSEKLHETPDPPILWYTGRMAQEYQTATIEEPGDLRAGDIWIRFEVENKDGSFVAFKGYSTPFPHRLVQQTINAGNNTVERPVAGDSQVDTFQWRVKSHDVSDLVCPIQGGVIFNNNGEEYDDGDVVHVTITCDPHTAVMGKVVAEGIIDSREMNATPTISGGSALAFMESVCRPEKPDRRIIVIDADS